MDDSTRMKRALGRTLPDEPAVPDPYADLARARAASRARGRRRFRLGLGGLALVVCAGVGVAGVLDRAPGPAASPSASAAPIELLSTPLHATPYSFDLTPKGWSVQAQTRYFVTIVPDDGSTTSAPDVFVGKLVISFDHHPLGGHLVGDPGRPVSIHGDSGYTTMSMRTAPGEPRGVVRIQYPDDTGWDRAAMVRFLRSVHVGPGARPSLG
ncbi:MAG: hypothetical protein QM747_11380 [Nocardioides sp.]